MSRPRASQLFFVFIGARRRECLIAAQNEKKKKSGGFAHTCRQFVPVMISLHERKLISACVRHMNTVTH